MLRAATMHAPVTSTSFSSRRCSFGGAILRFVVPGGENTILDWKKSIES